MQQPLRITFHGVEQSNAVETRVREQVRVRDKQIVVTRPNDGRVHDHVYVALRDAFDAATRQLDEHLRRRAGEVKTHAGDRP